jgi:hypothetical protein
LVQQRRLVRLKLVRLMRLLMRLLMLLRLIGRLLASERRSAVAGIFQQNRSIGTLAMKLSRPVIYRKNT